MLEIVIEFSTELPADAIEIRKAVFMKEQGFKDEFDLIDDLAEHMVIYMKEVPIATCRFFKDKEHGMYVLGRIAVVKKERGKGFGEKIVLAAEEKLKEKGEKLVGLSAQERASKFYERLGYKKKGGTYLDEGVPHIWMEKAL